MQTFLPFEDFQKSASILDKKRCWKQVVESSQILNVLRQLNNNETPAWRNHPAVKMWVGYAEALKHYYNIFLNESKNIRLVNTNLQYFDTIYSYEKNGNLFVDVLHIQGNDKPWWLGNENFHRAMRARLIEKDESFYLPKFPEDKKFNNSKYFWPNMDGSKTFRII